MTTTDLPTTFQTGGRGPSASAIPVIELRRLTRNFRKPPGLANRIARAIGARVAGDQTVHAVDGIDLQIFPGEVVGLAGESGCGKSTLGRMIAGILEPSSGQILYRGQDVAGLTARERRDYMLASQMIFQDPFTSLNPRMRVGEIIGEAPAVHRMIGSSRLDDYVGELMSLVKLDPSYRVRYPHQFSGGQRQRIGIARAIGVRPQVIVCDEAVAALDVSIQAQVLNLFMELRDRFGFTYVFISHDLSVIRHLSDRVAIMYLGRIVEEARTDELFGHPATPILGRCWARCLGSTAAGAGSSRWPERFRRPSTRPAAATSTRAAPWRCRSAGR